MQTALSTLHECPTETRAPRTPPAADTDSQELV